MDKWLTLFSRHQKVKELQVFMFESQYLEKTRSQLGKYFIYIFGLVFYTSWIYEINALGEGSGVYFQGLKHLLMLALLVLLVVSIKWRAIKPDIFLLACGVWLLFNLFPLIEHQEPVARYLLRTGQAVFFFLFVSYLRQHPEKNPCFGPAAGNWFFPWWIFWVLWFVIALNVTGWLAADVEGGFGNSRVNFSIWLMQLVALFLLMRLAGREVKPKVLIECLLLITPAFILQNMTGGRSGLLGSFLLVCVFAYRWGGVKALLVSGLWLYVVALGVAHYHPLISPENNLNVFRNVGLTDYSTLNEIIVWLDQLSSYRVSILITAFSSLDPADYWFGAGLGNFSGWAPTYPELGITEVHNVFLKILGEYGVFGFLAAVFLTAWPVAYRPANVMVLLALYVQSIYFVVAMVHPDLMLTAINPSLVYLSCYAYSVATRAAPTGGSSR